MTRLVTGVVRLGAVHLFEPHDQGKYSCDVVIPKSDQATLGKINAAIEAAGEPGSKSPLRDDGETVSLTASASSKYPPGVFDRNVNPISDPTEIHAGCLARVAMTAFAHDGGVSFGLNSVQKVADA